MAGTIAPEGEEDMTEFHFYLSDDDTDRVFQLMDDEGIKDLTANEYLEHLVSDLLRKKCPVIKNTEDLY